MSAPLPTDALTIGLDCRFLRNRFDGIGRYSYNMLAGLCRATGAHRVVAFVYGSGARHLDSLSGFVRSGRLEIQPIDVPPYHPCGIWRWPARQGAQAIDRFHAPYHIWAPLHLPCPLITTVHDLIFDRYPRVMPQWYLWPAYKLISYLAIRSSDRIIACSHATKRDIVRYTRVAEHKITVVPLGVDPLFSPVLERQKRDAVRQRYGLPGEFVLALGSRRPHKNIDRLIAGFASIVGDVPHTLVIIGPGGNRAQSPSRALVALRRQNRIRELEYVQEEDLPVLYSLATLFVQPSIIEGFGLPVIEAMGCGCPVACSNTSSLPEVAGNAALLFDPFSVPAIAETVRHALLSPKVRHDLSQAGLHRASQFTWEQTIVGSLKVYL